MLYAAAAFTFAALIPDGSWPAIGDNEFPSGQATVVPALNVFVAGAIILASADNVPHRRSLTAALAAATIRGAERAGHDLDLVDLAADGFNPVMTRDDLLAWRQRTAVDPLTLDYQRRLLEADHLVSAFPIWWEAMPAMTKGFLDKVVAKGIHFEELPEAKGNPFRNHMTRLGGVTALTVMTTPTPRTAGGSATPSPKSCSKAPSERSASRI